MTNFGSNVKQIYSVSNGKMDFGQKIRYLKVGVHPKLAEQPTRLFLGFSYLLRFSSFPRRRINILVYEIIL